MKIAKRLLLVSLVLFGLLVVGAFIMNHLAPNPVSAAKTYCIQQGWQEDQISFNGYNSSAKISGSRATVRFKVNDPSQERTIRVELRKSLYGVTWNVIEFDAPARPEHTSGD